MHIFRPFNGPPLKPHHFRGHLGCKFCFHPIAWPSRSPSSNSAAITERRIKSINLTMAFLVNLKNLRQNHQYFQSLNISSWIFVTKLSRVILWLVYGDVNVSTMWPGRSISTPGCENPTGHRISVWISSDISVLLKWKHAWTKDCQISIISTLLWFASETVDLFRKCNDPCIWIPSQIFMDYWTYIRRTLNHHNT